MPKTTVIVTSRLAGIIVPSSDPKRYVLGAVKPEDRPGADLEGESIKNGRRGRRGNLSSVRASPSSEIFHRLGKKYFKLRRPKIIYNMIQNIYNNIRPGCRQPYIRSASSALAFALALPSSSSSSSPSPIRPPLGPSRFPQLLLIQLPL